MNFSKYRALLGWLNILGILVMGLSLIGIITTHPLVKTTYSAMHLVAVPAGFLVLLGSIALKANADGQKLGRLGSLAFGLLAIGLVLYMVGNFFYAILHGLLNLVNTSDNIHQVPLNTSRFFVSLGFIILAVALLKWCGLGYLPAWALLLGALIFFFGYNAFLLSLFRRRDYKRYFEAATLVLPLVFAWIWISYNHIIRPRNKVHDSQLIV